MPYIILKRSDIPVGTLQVLDLTPNTSQRNLTIDPPGQTKYVDPVINETVVTHQPAGGGTTTRMYREADGLAAWIITNLNDGTGAPGTGTFTIAAATPVIAGDTATVGLQVFTAVAGARTPGSNDFSIDSGTDNGIALELAAAINDPLNGLTQPGGLSNLVTASVVGAVVTVDADADGTAGNLVLASDNAAGFSPVGMAGGVDAGAVTAANANAGALAILALYAFGDLTAAAGVLTLAAINGALAGGAAIVAAQLSSVLDILAGRHYHVPQGVQIETGAGVWLVSPAIGAQGGPAFVTGTLRNLYNTGSLILSYVGGELEGFRASTFIYGGVAGNPNGEAVAIYADDGTLFVP